MLYFKRKRGKAMSLTKCEQETIINFDEAAQQATVYTCNKAMMRQLDKLAQISSIVIEEKQDQYSKTYVIPKKWIKIKMPRILSSEQKQEMANRARVNFHGKKEKIINDI
jgi:hypothetical protein